MSDKNKEWNDACEAVARVIASYKDNVNAKAFAAVARSLKKETHNA